MSIGDAEIKTQERVIRFFKDPEILGYQYIGNLSDYQNKNIKEDRLRQYLRLKGYAEKLIDAAVMQLQQEAGNLSRGVYDANKTVYARLKYGIPVSESPEKPPVTVELIDEANPLNNDFAIAEEVTVVEQQEKRPDLVIYLNGIAVAVLCVRRHPPESHKSEGLIYSRLFHYHAVLYGRKRVGRPALRHASDRREVLYGVEG